MRIHPHNQGLLIHDIEVKDPILWYRDPINHTIIDLGADLIYSEYSEEYLEELEALGLLPKVDPLVEIKLNTSMLIDQVLHDKKYKGSYKDWLCLCDLNEDEEDINIEDWELEWDERMSKHQDSLRTQLQLLLDTDLLPVEVKAQAVEVPVVNTEPESNWNKFVNFFTSVTKLAWNKLTLVFSSIKSQFVK